MATDIAVPLGGAGNGDEDDAGSDVVDVVGAAAGEAAEAGAERTAEDVDEQQQEDDRQADKRERHRRVAQHVPQLAPQHRGRVGHGVGKGAHRTDSFSVSGWPVRARKTSSRWGGASPARPSAIDVGVEAVAPPPRSDFGTACAGRLQGARRRCPRWTRRWTRAADPSAARGVDRGSEVSQFGDVATHARAQGSAVPSATSRAVVEHRDPVGEAVRLLQVLRGEEDGHAVGHEVADDLPHRAPAARVQAGGRLVEEDDPRVGDQAHREVEPAPHAARVGGGGLAAASTRSKRSSSWRRAGGLRARPRWWRSAIRIRFSSPVSRLSDGRNWPVTPIAARTASGSRARSWPATRTAPASAPIRVEDLDDGGLAGAVGAEQREDRSPRRRRGRRRRARVCAP